MHRLPEAVQLEQDRGQAVHFTAGCARACAGCHRAGCGVWAVHDDARHADVLRVLLFRRPGVVPLLSRPPPRVREHLPLDADGRL